MTASRRATLPTLKPTTEHPGLILDRYLEQTGDKHESAKQLYDIVCASTPGDLYRKAFARWETMLSDLGASCQVFTTRTRLIVGLGSESVRETGITLHHTYGLPYIPGSALKGLLARYLAEEIPWITEEARRETPTTPGLTPSERAVLTGTPDAASFVTFFDAWYVARPGDTAGSPFRHDVITVHHPVYYASRGKTRAPWDFDDPTPVPFVSAAGDYLIAVSCPGGSDWEKIAMTVLTAALRDWGIGGKTSSGYGRMKPATNDATTTPNTNVAGATTDIPASSTPPPPPLSPALSPDAAELHDEIIATTVDNLHAKSDLYLMQWRFLSDPTEQAIIARLIVDKLTANRVLEKWSSLPWVIEITNSLRTP